MRYACTAHQAQALDQAVISGLGLPGIALMELAARGVADAVRAHHAAAAAAGVVVACGPGNNGGDGWAVARWLRGWGLPVAVWELGEPKPGTDASIERAVALKAGVDRVSGLGSARLVVDALFGTGLARGVGPPYDAAVGAIVDARARGATVVAVDLPSGLSSDTGQALGDAVTADRTVTFGRPKLGMFLGGGPDLCGVVDVVDIGLDAATPDDRLAAAEIPDAADLEPLWPVRRPSDHKASQGHLLVIAGSAAMTGAAILACRGALAAGAGLVSLVATRPMRPRLAALPPEVMVVDGGDGDVLCALPELERFDGFVVGPGLGGGSPLDEALGRELARRWATDPRPWVFDADALPCAFSPGPAPRVITPHPGEAGRLLGLTSGQVQTDRLSCAHRLTDRGVVLLKGRYSVIAAQGALPSLNPTGCPVLATGGTGDVLAGVIGALLTRGVGARDAARLGAFVHGLAADRLGARRRDGWTASDVAEEIARGGWRPASPFPPDAG